MEGQLLGYARVSSADQNPERQTQAIGEVARVFTDRASGGSTNNRPALKELIAYARDGDTIRVSSIDRLARSTRHLNDLIARFNERGVTVEFVKEQLRFAPGKAGNPMDELMLGLLGAIAQFERALIRERQAEGIAAAKKRGVYDRGPKLTPEGIAKAKKLIAEGVPKTKVAALLRVSRSTIYQALKGAGSYA